MRNNPSFLSTIHVEKGAQCAPFLIMSLKFLRCDESLLRHDCLFDVRISFLCTEQDEVIDDHFRPVELDLLGILPAARLQMSFDVEGLALLDVFAAELAEFAPGNEIVELRLALLCACGVFPRTVGRETKCTNRLAFGRRFDLGIMRHVPEEGNSIHRFHKKWGKKIEQPHGTSGLELCVELRK